MTTFGDQVAARARECVGLSYGDPETREAYVRHLYPGDTLANALSLGSTQSSCLLHLRGLLAEEYLDGDALWRDKEIDLLRVPYAEHIGVVEGLLQEWCRQRGGGINRGYGIGVEMPEFQPGELVVIGTGLATHGVCVLEQSDEVVTSSDGGQTDRGNGFRPTAIAERVRRLQRIGGVWHLGDRPIIWSWR